MKKINTAIKYAKGYLTYTEKKIIARWGSNDVIKHNWGDALNPILIHHLSDRKPIYYKDIVNVYNKPVYCVIGSYLGIVRNDNSIIWGTGFGYHNDKLKIKPKQICAVRGPLTVKKIKEQGLYCPEVYGDPALLYPLFYYPKQKPVYKLGVIAHVREQDAEWYQQLNEEEDLIKIDITSGISHVINQILKCNYIASSALHGIIAADSYGIPTLRLKITDKPLGDGFKYLDYFESVSRDDYEPLVVSDDIGKYEMLNAIEKRYCKPQLDIKKLLESCPFIDKSVLKGLETGKVFKRNEIN